MFADYPSDATFEATEADVLAIRQLLWVAFDGTDCVACATTAIDHTPARKLCRITSASGVNTKLWDRFMPMVEAYARNEGCASLRVEGRKGWKRVLKDFDEPWIVLNKELA
ncbi:MAG TPA: hypothetical protein VEU47_10905 [Candidatus Cybelea sp.]|nr:hypothetical protein [Candidatus Cybelea sp.]